MALQALRHQPTLSHRQERQQSMMSVTFNQSTRLQHHLRHRLLEIPKTLISRRRRLDRDQARCF
jgi:hypothetical protein